MADINDELESRVILCYPLMLWYNNLQSKETTFILFIPYYIYLFLGAENR